MHKTLKRLLLCTCLVGISLHAAATPSGQQSGTTDWQVSTQVKVPKSTADHSKFKALQGPFKSGEDVTKACLSCHTEAAKQVMGTRHWTWEYTNPDTGQKLGKKTMLNTFCIGDQSNEAFCHSCHVGYGWKDNKFDFKVESKVDCLVCHNTVGGYKKPGGLAGEVVTERMEYPKGSGKFLEPIDLALIAKHVGKTSTATCGTCHYRGGGGDGVKHGDLDSSLDKATRDLDVHMASKSKGGAGFTCSTCHQADGHQLSGSRIQMTASDPHGPILRGTMAHLNRNAATCQSCHGDKPHKEPLLSMQLLNNHTNKLACQSCHIPSFARGGVATKMKWDWSVAGRLSEKGKPIQIKDEKGHVTYDSKKGSFELGEDVVPDYVWFNGTVTYTTQEDKIDPSQTVLVNRFHGSPDDPKARIWPVKRFEGKQPYDKVHRTLLVPHTAIPDDSAFWYNFDWPKALAAGAKTTGQPFSGEFDFVKTEMLWPITHMVAPSAQAVSCTACHASPLQSRLGGLPGVYLPARDQSTWLDRIGWFAVLGALLGVIVHLSVRILTSLRRRKEF